MNRTVYFREQLNCRVTSEWLMGWFYAETIWWASSTTCGPMDCSSSLPKFSLCVFIHAHTLSLFSVFYDKDFLRTPNDFLTWKKRPNIYKKGAILSPVFPSPFKEMPTQRNDKEKQNNVSRRHKSLIAECVTMIVMK